MLYLIKGYPLRSTTINIVHEGGFRLEKDYRDRWFFKRPDGRAVPDCGYRPEDMRDDDLDAAGEYLHSDRSAEGWRNPSAEGLSMRLHSPPLTSLPRATAEQSMPPG
jgi:hypothetical protein